MRQQALDVVTDANCKRHDRQCRWRASAGWKHRAARDKQIAQTVNSAVRIHDTLFGVVRHAGGAGGMMSGHLRQQRILTTSIETKITDAPWEKN